jgi:hypothetical protein
MKSLILACLSLSVVSTLAAQQPADAIVKPYLEIQAQLAADRFEEAKAPAKALAAQAASLGQERGGRIVKAAADVEKAADIKAARDAFGPLSDAVIERLKADGGGDGLKIGFCPMIKRSWVQREDQVKNPYFGASMLTCGELKPAK